MEMIDVDEDYVVKSMKPSDGDDVVVMMVFS